MYFDRVQGCIAACFSMRISLFNLFTTTVCISQAKYSSIFVRSLPLQNYFKLRRILRQCEVFASAKAISNWLVRLLRLDGSIERITESISVCEKHNMRENIVAYPCKIQMKSRILPALFSPILTFTVGSAV